MNPDTVKGILIKDNTDVQFKNEWNNKTKTGKMWASTQNWGARVNEWNKLISK
jgi:hypothetical protein